jgi:DNA-binding transcriptional LysR family regulator
VSLAEGFEEFVAIVDVGSVTGAADVLGLPRPTLSRRLARLEERLGARLLHRTTRRLTLTRAGALLYEKASRVVESARAAEAEVQRLDGVPRGLLRVSVPTALPPTFAEWMVDFLARHSEVRMELVASSTPVDLIAARFDVALRRGDIEDGSLIVRTLVFDESIAVASPAYLETAGAPEDPEALANHDCIATYHSGRATDLQWPLRDGTTIGVAGRLRTSEMGLNIEAARAGLGVALVSKHSAAVHLASGALVHVLPDTVGRRERVSLVHANRAYVEPKVRAFIDFFVACVEQRREKSSAL